MLALLGKCVFIFNENYEGNRKFVTCIRLSLRTKLYFFMKHAWVKNVSWLVRKNMYILQSWESFEERNLISFILSYEERLGAYENKGWRRWNSVHYNGGRLWWSGSEACLRQSVEESKYYWKKLKPDTQDAGGHCR